MCFGDQERQCVRCGRKVAASAAMFKGGSYCGSCMSLSEIEDVCGDAEEDIEGDAEGIEDLK